MKAILDKPKRFSRHTSSFLQVQSDLNIVRLHPKTISKTYIYIYVSLRSVTPRCPFRDVSRHCGVLFRSHGCMWTELKVRSENLGKTTPIPMDDYGWWSCFCLFKLYIIYIHVYIYIYIHMYIQYTIYIYNIYVLYIYSNMVIWRVYSIFRQSHNL